MDHLTPVAPSFIGSWLAMRHLKPGALRLILAALLLIAGAHDGFLDLADLRRT